jgi:hypothetical protein
MACQSISAQSAWSHAAEVAVHEADDQTTPGVERLLPFVAGFDDVYHWAGCDEYACGGLVFSQNV